MAEPMNALKIPGADAITARKVLAVDDDEDIRRLLEMILHIEGYQVTTASNGQEALERVAAEVPDVMLLDIMMPIMDGYEVLQSLRKDVVTFSVPVIVISAKYQPSDIKHVMDLGADYCIAKPFDWHSLTTVVKDACAKPSTNAQETAWAAHLPGEPSPAWLH